MMILNIKSPQIQCCGADSYNDWLNVTWYDNVTTGVVPLSCCAMVGGCGKEDYLLVDNTTLWSEVCR